MGAVHLGGTGAAGNIEVGTDDGRFEDHLKGRRPFLHPGIQFLALGDHKAEELADPVGADEGHVQHREEDGEQTDDPRQPLGILQGDPDAGPLFDLPAENDVQGHAGEEHGHHQGVPGLGGQNEQGQQTQHHPAEDHFPASRAGLHQGAEGQHIHGRQIHGHRVGIAEAEGQIPADDAVDHIHPVMEHQEHNGHQHRQGIHHHLDEFRQPPVGPELVHGLHKQQRHDEHDDLSHIGEAEASLMDQQVQKHTAHRQGGKTHHQQVRLLDTLADIPQPQQARQREGRQEQDAGQLIDAEHLHHDNTADTQKQRLQQQQIHIFRFHTIPPYSFKKERTMVSAPYTSFASAANTCRSRSSCSSQLRASFSSSARSPNSANPL